MVNGWKSGKRRLDLFTQKMPGLNIGEFTLRLLAIGNRLDLFKADSIRKINSAGEGRFVFTNTIGFDVSPSENDFFKIDKAVNHTIRSPNIRTSRLVDDVRNFTLIFEYELPGKDFASLARWAKDWHKLEVQNLGTGGSFVPTSEYLNTLNELTYRFSNRGADRNKPNGNPINQVRTNEFLSGVWQMREFNLLPKSRAESITSRKTVLKSEFDLNKDVLPDADQVGLWTTTTKNNPLIGNRKLDSSLEGVLSRWINQKENQILDSVVSPAAPGWMDGAVANQPLVFHTVKILDFRYPYKLGCHKFSLSTCSGCHNGDTNTFSR